MLTFRELRINFIPLMTKYPLAVGEWVARQRAAMNKMKLLDMYKYLYFFKGLTYCTTKLNRRNSLQF
jgi:hypothetical protein